MTGGKPEFDGLSASYEELLRDPIRDRFAGASAAFFHTRKRDLIRAYFKRRAIDTRKLSFLDLGCGKGDLLRLLQGDFARVSGCDPSAGMLESGGLKEVGIDARVMPNDVRTPFASGEFDFVTAVSVYHHVPLPLREALTAEINRILKPGGILAIIEHNPFNPITRLIVSRTPVDADAVLLSPGETRRTLRQAGFQIDDQRFFLYFPESLYRKAGGLESMLGSVPLGGQYAIFAKRGLPDVNG